MTRDDLDIAIAWAAGEGWNPGLDDADAFFAADPGGHHIAREDGEPVAVISAVRYGTGFGFVGFYITRPERRGEGIGHGLWQHALATLGDRTVGLDGVVDQQHNYRKSGFALAHRNIRMSGIAAGGSALDPRLAMIGRGIFPSIRDYDRRFFPEERDAFLAAWLGPSETRRGLALIEDGAVRGYGVLRACEGSFKIGPLFAETAEEAEVLFTALSAQVAGQEIMLDVPEPNAAALALAENHGLSPVFETARMYKGPAPDLPLECTFGITTFELG